MKTKYFILIGFLFFITFLSGFLANWKLYQQKESKQTIITGQSILTLLKERNFLITQTYIFNQPITIQKTSGSSLKDFFFGQTITANGVVEVNMGVDLSKLQTQDIQINNQKITINIPPAKLFNARLIGDINLKNKQGILKKIFQNDDGYNEALKTLITTAEKNAKKPELIEQSNQKAQQHIADLLKFTTSQPIEVIIKNKITSKKPDKTNIICAQDAKQCPNGSFVSRQGPNCEFAICPK